MSFRPYNVIFFRKKQQQQHSNTTAQSELRCTEQILVDYDCNVVNNTKYTIH